MLGGKKKVIEPKHHMVDVVSIATQNKAITPPREEMFGKFTFSAPSYSILESAGVLQIDVIFHRRRTR
ncbi:hypothetical protein LSAT2_024629 [Lamellibrachia satsuma]|nr:hypothetical protein LSAT2_024629 [Lamellibrachia satsuma]